MMGCGGGATLAVTARTDSREQTARRRRRARTRLHAVRLADAVDGAQHRVVEVAAAQHAPVLAHKVLEREPNLVNEVLG